MLCRFIYIKRRYLAFWTYNRNNIAMYPEQTVYAYSRLVLGALAVFLAIVLWTKTRDAAWILVIVSALTAYVEIIWSVLETAGINAGGFFPLAAAALPALRMIFLIAAFLVMIIRHRRHQ